jgi:hypothetical protein
LYPDSNRKVVEVIGYRMFRKNVSKQEVPRDACSFATQLNDAVMSGIPVVDIRIYASVDSWETQIFTRLGVAPVCRAGPRALVFWTERRLKIDHTPESIMVAVR